MSTAKPAARKWPAAPAPAPATGPETGSARPQDPEVGGRFERLPDGSLRPLDAPPES